MKRAFLSTLTTVTNLLYLYIYIYIYIYEMFGLKINISSGLMAEIMWSVCKSKSHRSLCVSFSRTGAGLSIYHLLVWSRIVKWSIPLSKRTSSSSCRAASTDIPDPLSPLLLIVHRLWLVFRAPSPILTELLCVCSSWPSCFCSAICSGP